MVSIRENFIHIIEVQKKMGYPFPSHLLPPATPLEIKDTEKKLEFALNDELKELYSFANGTNINEPTELGLTGLIPIYDFLSLQQAVDCYQANIQFDQTFQNMITGFQPGNNLFPFLANMGGDNYWVDLNANTEHYGKIYWTNTLGEEPKYKYDSLAEMFSAIRTAYDTNVIHLDPDGYLDCDNLQFENIRKP